MTAFVNSRPHATILSLGAGICAHELDACQWFTVPFTLDCLDLNEQLLEQGRARAQARGVCLNPICQDANLMQLEPKRYDLILGHNCLHHFVELEHVFLQVSRSLKPDGRFFVLDVSARNRMVLWPEAAVVADALWQLLPPRLRRDLTAPEGSQPVRDMVPNVPAPEEAFECVRSQDILPLLRHFFPLEHLVPDFAFTRHFVENNFGPNYDLDDPEDRALLDLICDIDLALVNAGLLRPENFFAWTPRSELPAEDFQRAAEESHARSPEADEPQSLSPQAELAMLRREVQLLRWELDALRKSTSFRLGRYIVSKLEFLRPLLRRPRRP